MEILALILMGALAVAGILLYSTFTWGLVCFKFWAWFVVPIFISGFPTLPELTFIEACSLMFFIGLFRNQSSTSIKKEYRDEGTSWGQLILTPWVVLLIGWGFKSLFC